jgi:hypothetical protein
MLLHDRMIEADRVSAVGTDCYRVHRVTIKSTNETVHDDPSIDVRIASAGEKNRPRAHNET